MPTKEARRKSIDAMTAQGLREYALEKACQLDEAKNIIKALDADREAMRNKLNELRGLCAIISMDAEKAYKTAHRD